MSTIVSQQIFLNNSPYSHVSNVHSGDRAEVIERMRQVRPEKETETLSQWWEDETVRTISTYPAQEPSQEPMVIRSIMAFEQM